jgi:hypothetical protein
MLRILRTITLAFIGVAALGPTAGAQPSFFSEGTPYNATGLSNYLATGASMSGMLVSWRFSDNSQFQSVWGDIGGGDCGVDNGGFRLSFNCVGITAVGAWSLQNNSGKTLNTMRLNGAPGRTVFDCGWFGTECGKGIVGQVEGTPGSSDGMTFTKVGGSYALDGVGSYANLVGVGGAAPVGDLFEQFSVGFVGLPSGQSYEFWLDTDNTSPDAPPPTVAPEPQTFAMLFAGLAVLGVGARRRARVAVTARS